MKFLSANLGTILVRYYLMMAVVIAAFYLNMPLMAILALPIFFSAMLGIKIEGKKKNDASQSKEIYNKLIEQAA